MFCRSLKDMKAQEASTACVEPRFSDGSRININTVGVENAVAANLYQRSELDWLIYNKRWNTPSLSLGGA